jgi:hypothetical protein
MLIVRPSARFLGGQLQLIPFFLFIAMTGEIYPPMCSLSVPISLFVEGKLKFPEH